MQQKLQLILCFELMKLMVLQEDTEPLMMRTHRIVLPFVQTNILIVGYNLNWNQMKLSNNNKLHITTLTKIGLQIILKILMTTMMMNLLFGWRTMNFPLSSVTLQQSFLNSTTSSITALCVDCSHLRAPVSSHSALQNIQFLPSLLASMVRLLANLGAPSLTMLRTMDICLPSASGGHSHYLLVHSGHCLCQSRTMSIPRSLRPPKKRWKQRKPLNATEQTSPHYHANNGIFAFNLWTSHCQAKQQGLSFAGVGVHHQNGVAKNKTQQLQSQARSMLIYAAK
jgi:hypothetical protein